jgi:UDP-N-acetylmuramate: L-alanyl-gamma-D-glutamyl-meso-diaminopimelate ligase
MSLDKVHFIAIGGSIMHNLALSLHDQGIEVTGSDDIIYDPARSRLKEAGILPREIGWDPDRIHEELDLVILGMHAKKDNPELSRAMDLGIEVLSFPEYVGKYNRAGSRIAICGSHGKTTTTSMVMHTLNFLGVSMDYLVGSQLEGFDRMVKVTGAPSLVVEGDEYLSSALDPRPKFLHYDPTICLLTGLDWDHINVFPTEEGYLNAFRTLIDSLSPEATLVYNNYDPKVKAFVEACEPKCDLQPYINAKWSWKNDQWEIDLEGKRYDWSVPGEHNLNNLLGAMAVLQVLGINMEEALDALKRFTLPLQRMNLLYDGDDLMIYKDFAHAPSKVRASVSSMSKVKGKRKMIAVLEIHTYSSLNKDYLPQYNGALDLADKAFVYFNPRNLEIKRMTALEPDFLRKAFGRADLEVCTDSESLKTKVYSAIGEEEVLLLLMSSSNFGGLDWLSVLT